MIPYQVYRVLQIPAVWLGATVSLLIVAIALSMIQRRKPSKTLLTAAFAFVGLELYVIVDIHLWEW
ncbi:MAG: hypothetical protein OSA48_06740 [Akkermansiaceae bacterium]|jgi:galactitol-specific phosphotransferase system IIC component|nr:hypothetical protein [Akkermansiaceae bacterium]